MYTGSCSRQASFPDGEASTYATARPLRTAFQFLRVIPPAVHIHSALEMVPVRNGGISENVIELQCDIMIRELLVGDARFDGLKGVLAQLNPSDQAKVVVPKWDIVASI